MTAIQTEPSAAVSSGTSVEHVLTLDCPEGPGIVHAVSGFLLEHGCDIIDNKQFGDRAEGHFFMRVHFASDGDDTTVDTLRASFAPVGEKYGMNWQLERQGYKRKVLIMVSKFGHCLNDLLFRARIGELPIDVVGVVSNHLDHQGLAEWHGIPYFHVPVTAATKPAAEARLLDIIDELDVELVVLARYMQVLSDDLARKLDGRAINIHHSFLPSFKGAKPYHQAYARGVKTVGATAHYVNGELDEGPIISQQVVEVDHTFGPEDLVAAGRDTECKALSNAVRWHCEGRIILNGNRTIVLK
ncbi:formyltetrahydrofolate deformylase [Arthrobacter sp. TES]|uniref:Formyltetrahydrofolate deformylase n=1 Tax=Paenarthrobacter ureafaciens TaxID=37931 RepID=A0AAX3EGT1_PAEUR|nr:MULTISPECIES: formyltetrahydrofolate deformylase [Paenarthrobacter]AMB41919.1 formyltetrahydrofolate deformylase [Arthrobacter sp. ATCC 21022]AOY73762.1 formyltetrahydrofolate deformylase [Arthrobacter sp. ZXY-2]NKR13775.1 formyltetrahydrofolate deformylase [Arthrobacter sp. M5]NKR17991.1 formyltetrahydrofolate deformylase [Arthrobacter sp. M6]OEH59064.1 formyltetrahydrofolate deformylase [Arthrobacter sp. D4]OEH59096.1 formyltetrahydrofolate deformylase [Arthrobacter sp. D2]QOI61890.1 fo